MLWPIELNAARSPGAGQSDQGRFDDRVPINEVIAVRLVPRGVNPSPKLGQNHDLDELILNVNRIVAAVLLPIGESFDARQRVDASAAALVNATLQEHRTLLRGMRSVGGNNDGFAPYAHRG